MEKIEFYTFNNEVWYRTDTNHLKVGKDCLKGGQGHLNCCQEHKKLTEGDKIVESLVRMVEEFYPKAYAALEKEYQKIADISNRYYRMAVRFVKCNFGEIDNVYDIQSAGRFVFECVRCPLRGECKWEGVICQPEFNSELSKREKEVLRLVYFGKQIDDIAEQLYLSPHTIKNHIRNAYARLDIHSTAEFIVYANEHKLYDDERLG